jgi:hypothetical protein
VISRAIGTSVTPVLQVRHLWEPAPTTGSGTDYGAPPDCPDTPTIASLIPLPDHHGSPVMGAQNHARSASEERPLSCPVGSQSGQRREHGRSPHMNPMGYAVRCHAGRPLGHTGRDPLILLAEQCRLPRTHLRRPILAIQSQEVAKPAILQLQFRHTLGEIARPSFRGVIAHIICRNGSPLARTMPVRSTSGFPSQHPHHLHQKAGTGSAADPGAIYQDHSAVSHMRAGTFAKMPSLDTSGIPSRRAVAATHRSASCWRWASACPMRSQSTRRRA